jgi:tetratricopeptide (TPR) repeat protein
MDCPRCGTRDVTTPECPACGVMIAKARSARPRPERTLPPTAAPAPAWRSLLLPALGLALLIGAAVLHLRQTGGEAAAVGSARQRPSANASPPAGADALPEPVTLRENPPAGPPPTFVAQAPASDPAAAADLATATRLISRLNAQVPLSPEDVRDAEGLYARHPAEARDLLEGVLLAAAARAQAARRFDAAATLLQRAVTIAPESPRPLRMQLGLGLVTSDWPAAEQAGRALLALSPRDAEGARGLAYALVRQDRTREAVELLNGFLATTEDAEARALLARIQHDSAAEKSLSEAKLAHFHVRYDGEAHEDVGREILRLLDRHYATLARSFDHEPGQPIPVILLSRESYYDATGAPAWSGGQYDSFDGRVRIPIAGLSAALTPDLDQTLVHELTHSFVNDLSGGAAPRDLHEGLAQYMEGRRIAQLDSDRLRALANGQLAGVSGFYFNSLWLVEDLAAQRGSGGLNDLLRAMGSSGNVDQAFRSVYGSDFATLKRQAAGRLRLRYGG